MKAYHSLFYPATTDARSATKHSTLIAKMRYHAPALIFLFVLICLSYPGWFSSAGMSFDDLTRLNAPQRMFVGAMLRQGKLPLWNPYNFGGQPFLAAGQSGPLYLPNVIFAILPINSALKLSYMFHATLAAVSMYMITFRLTRQRTGAVVSGLVFVTSGFMLGHQIHTQMYDAMSIVPLSLYFLFRLLSNPNWKNTLGLAVAVAMEIYAGHPQISFYLTIVLFVSFVTIIFLTWSEGVRERAISVVSSGILALLLSAPQWLPTVLLIPYSDRSHASKQFLLQASLPPSGLIQFLTPFSAGGGYTGTPLAGNFARLYGTSLFWELTCYAGLAALLLAVTAGVIGFTRHPVIPALVLQGALGILLALGGYGPLQWFLVHAPGFDMFRVPGRYTVLAELSIAILSGIGIAVVRNAINTRAKLPLVLLTVFSGLAILTLVWARFTGPLRLAPESAFLAPVGIALALVAAAWLMWFRRPAKSFVSGVAIASIACLDMVVQSAGWSSFVLSGTPVYAVQSGVTAFLKAQEKPSEPLVKTAAMPDTSLAFDQSSAFQLPTLNGYDSLEAAWYANYVDLTWSAAGILSEPRSMMDALGVRFLLTRRNVNPLFATAAEGSTSLIRHVKVPVGTTGLLVQVGSVNAPGAPLFGPLLSVTLESGNTHLTELLTGMPNQKFLIPVPSTWPKDKPTKLIVRNETWQEQVQVSAVSWLSTGKRLDSFVSGVWVSPEPWRAVYRDATETVWENEADVTGAYVTTNADDPLVGTSGNATAVAFSANQQSWKVTASEDSLFVLGQTFDPGWAATVDGKSTPVTETGGLYGDMLTGIPVPRGTHIVKLTYHPLGFRTGRWMLLTGFLVTVVGTVLGRLDKRKRQPPRQ
ncbi:YfhO family protein [Alicyclobacillus mengziensis]|uniref:YfhO family protein n=1 Tax=Alicyclobacillus mengziensis TaxID=2931921 RepID=A0A9X7W1K9_9BACL|nr:YfhO family protein [Alicyclobacillus mengziensis]QSO49061.1 YfhO family protein [Alicyclobacillus mengziensis]